VTSVATPALLPRTKIIVPDLEQRQVQRPRVVARVVGDAARVPDDFAEVSLSSSPENRGTAAAPASIAASRCWPITAWSTERSVSRG
jgi:hypothetical protein